MSVKLHPLLLSCLCIAFSIFPVRAGELSTRIIDGLGRPIQEVDVEVYYFKDRKGQPSVKVSVLKVKSGADGMARGFFDEKSILKDEFLLTSISKNGFLSQTQTSPRDPEIILRKIFPMSDIDRVARLDMEARTPELRELLAGVFEGDGDIEGRVLLHEDRFHPSLRILITEPRLKLAAISALASIGDPEDLDWIAGHMPPILGEYWENRWVEKIVSAMVAPGSEPAWTLLRDCAIGQRYRGIAQEEAIRSLMFNATPRSRRILEEISIKIDDPAKLVRDAISYIDSHPKPLEDRDERALADRIGAVINDSIRRKVEPPSFNARRDKAWILLNFVDENDLYTWTLSLHRENDVWKFRGARETSHATLAREIAK